MNPLEKYGKVALKEFLEQNGLHDVKITYISDIKIKIVMYKSSMVLDSLMTVIDDEMSRIGEIKRRWWELFAEKHGDHDTPRMKIIALYVYNEIDWSGVK